MKLTFFILLCSISFQLSAQVCLNWSPEKKLGVLDHSIIDEASGLVVSRKFPNRLYHINDSGDGPFFYQTNINGEKTKKIKINNFKPFDVEDMGYGKCGDEQCLIIADIGDNAEVRSHLSLVFISEKEKFEKVVTAKKIVKVQYPDRAHNAEGLAIHPNGDIFILTKEAKKSPKRAFPSQVFVLPKENYERSQGEVLTLEYLGQFDFPSLLPELSIWGQIVTAFDISEDGRKILVLTYEAALELPIDLSTRFIPNLNTLRRGSDFKVLELNKLPQQEAISYIPGENAFIYNTEFKKKFGVAPILKHSCL